MGLATRPPLGYYPLMTDTPGPEIAFRVMTVTAALGLVGLLGSGWHGMIGLVLLVAAAAMLVEALVQKKAPMRLRRRRIAAAGIAFACGAVLMTGLMGVLSTPLLVVAGLSGALGVIGTLGDSGSSYTE